VLLIAGGSHDLQVDLKEVLSGEYNDAQVVSVFSVSFVIFFFFFFILRPSTFGFATDL
jgi:hypothetical protein